MGTTIPSDVHAKLTSIISTNPDLIADLKDFLDEPTQHSHWWSLRLWLVDYCFSELRPGTSYYMDPLACKRWIAFCLRYLSALLSNADKAYTADMVLNVIQNEPFVVDTLLFEEKSRCITLLEQVFHSPIPTSTPPQRPDPAGRLRSAVQAEISASRTVTLWTHTVIENLAARIESDMQTPPASVEYLVNHDPDNLSHTERFEFLENAARAGKADYALLQHVKRERVEFLRQRDRIQQTSQRLFRLTLVGVVAVVILAVIGNDSAPIVMYAIVLTLLGAYILFIIVAGIIHYQTGIQLRELEAQVERAQRL